MVDSAEWNHMVIFSRLLTPCSFLQPPPPATTPSATTSRELMNCPLLLGLQPSSVLMWVWWKEQVGKERIDVGIKSMDRENYSKLTCPYTECLEETYYSPEHCKINYFYLKLKHVKIRIINQYLSDACHGKDIISHKIIEFLEPLFYRVPSQWCQRMHSPWERQSGVRISPDKRKLSRFDRPGFSVGVYCQWPQL